MYLIIDGSYIDPIKLTINSFQNLYSVAHANLDSSKNMLLLKNLQFLLNHYETLSQYGIHEYLIVTKFRNDWIKIVDFLIKAYFCLSLS